MVKRIVRWVAISLVSVLLGIGGLLAYAYASPIPVHEFDASWYHTPRHVTEAIGRSFYTQHRWTVFHAAADHLVHPIGPRRAIILMGASSPDDSGDVFLYFGSAYVSGSTDLHLLPVYCWSEREKRLRWKGLQDNSP
jgi:hypothetical protein